MATNAEEIEKAEAAVRSAEIRVREALHWRNYQSVLRISEVHRGQGDVWDQAVSELDNGSSYVPEVRGCPRDRNDYEREYADADHELQQARYDREVARKHLKALRKG